MNGKSDSAARTVVLVHGGFVDGSGWEEVYKILRKDGYTVSNRSKCDNISCRRCCRNEAYN